MTFTQFYKNSLTALNPDFIVAAAVKSLDQNDLINDNISQLLRGEDSNGRILGYYTDATIQIKLDEGGFINPSGKIALINFGGFTDRFFVERTNKSAILGSKDSKAEMLKEDYGDDIFGLQESNEIKQMEKGRPKFIGMVENALFR